MPHYIALIHKDADSYYGVSFPDWPGVVTAGDTIDEAMQQAVEVLSFAADVGKLPMASRQFPSLAQSTNCAPIRNFARSQPMLSLRRYLSELRPRRPSDNRCITHYEYQFEN